MNMTYAEVGDLVTDALGKNVEFRLVEAGAEVNPSLFCAASASKFRQLSPENAWLPVSCFILGLELMGLSEVRRRDSVFELLVGVDEGVVQVRES